MQEILQHVPACHMAIPDCYNTRLTRVVSSLNCKRILFFDRPIL